MDRAGIFALSLLKSITSTFTVPRLKSHREFMGQFVPRDTDDTEQVQNY